MISFYFVKFTEMTGYLIGIKVRHAMKKNLGILDEFYNQFVAAKHVKVRIINHFFIPAPNDGGLIWFPSFGTSSHDTSTIINGPYVPIPHALVEILCFF
jgi:hypothetical protein